MIFLFFLNYPLPAIASLFSLRRGGRACPPSLSLNGLQNAWSIVFFLDRIYRIDMIFLFFITSLMKVMNINPPCGGGFCQGYLVLKDFCACRGWRCGLPAIASLRSLRRGGAQRILFIRCVKALGSFGCLDRGNRADAIMLYPIAP